jgi:hypothetical protein
MLLALSVVLVFGAVGVFVGNVAGSEQGQLGFGFEQMIHARTPWLLLASLLGGASLGVASLVRRRRWYKWAIVPVEVFFAALLTWYLASFSFLPEHRLALQVGDAFPAYALLDQDGGMHRMESGTPRRAALYIFYRGDW